MGARSDGSLHPGLRHNTLRPRRAGPDSVADKVFKAFDDSESGGEAIIGGTGRVEGDFLPQALGGVANLVVPSHPASVDAFRAAAANRPLAIEVGPGKGRFLNALAALHPEMTCLGIDTRLGFCLTTLRRAARAGRTNLFAGWGDARAVLPLLVRPGEASEAYLLFPDPWWKRRHAGRRHGPAMAAAIATALAPGGRLVLKSDVAEYLDAIVAAFTSTGAYDPATMPSDLPLTDREARLTQSGVRVFSAALSRR